MRNRISSGQFIRSIPPGPIAAPVDIEYLAKALYGVALLKPLYYRKLLSESGIKRAVAFFRISFSCSTRLSRFSRSCIRR